MANDNLFNKVMQTSKIEHESVLASTQHLRTNIAQPQSLSDVEPLGQIPNGDYPKELAYDATDPHSDTTKDYKTYKDNEGWSSTVYKDKQGNDTIGYGHKLTAEDVSSGRYANGITKQQGQDLLARDVKSHNDAFYKKNPWAKNQPQHVRTVLEDLAYNMGPNFTSKWTNFSRQLQAGDYAGAKQNILNNKVYNDQVKGRAVRNANALYR